jgi:hypothetical protein
LAERRWHAHDQHRADPAALRGRFNNGDLDNLMLLYEPDAVLVAQ